MFANKKFWNFFIAAIAVLTSIVTSSNPIQAKQTLVTAKANTEYTLVGFTGRYSPAHPPANSHQLGSRILARQWEMQRQARYNRCVRREHYPPHCQYILRERNPYI